MKRRTLVVLATVALILGTTAMPASAIVTDPPPKPWSEGCAQVGISEARVPWPGTIHVRATITGCTPLDSGEFSLVSFYSTRGVGVLEKFYCCGGEVNVDRTLTDPTDSSQGILRAFCFLSGPTTRVVCYRINRDVVIVGVKPVDPSDPRVHVPIYVSRDESGNEGEPWCATCV
jgi:hypothetical protein